ncbi:unnamed protein product, partial [Symbiodinium sp. CCMP2456]
ARMTMVGRGLGAVRSQLCRRWRRGRMNGAERSGKMLTALGNLGVEPDLWTSAIEVIKKNNSPVKDTALDATKADVQGYKCRIVQGLTDPAAITFADIAQDVTYAECVYARVWVYNLLTRLPCGYIPDAQKLGDVALEDGPQKRMHSSFLRRKRLRQNGALFAPAYKMLTEDNAGIVRVFACRLPDLMVVGISTKAGKPVWTTTLLSVRNGARSSSCKSSRGG